MDDQNCDCCEGTEILTPVNTANRPGLSALRYRIGTHGSFLETMKARLSSLAVQIPDSADPDKSTLGYPLRALTSRNSYDASIAMLDAWAIVGDVLTFYQERIANEGFLRTATERRSVLEMARLIGYALRPGVAASVFLALDLDKGYEIQIQPHEVKTQSVPSTPQDQPQVFENNETLDARAAWNRIGARKTRPQTVESLESRASSGELSLYLKGINANLKANDVMLLTEGDGAITVRVSESRPDPANDRTLVIFQTESLGVDTSAAVAAAQSLITEKPGMGRSRFRTEMAQRVTQLLKALIAQLQATGISADAANQAIRETVLKISEELDVAQREQYPRLREWLTGVLDRLNETAEQMTAVAGRERTFLRTGATSAMVVEPNDGELPEDPLEQSMSALTLRASVPPRNALNLDRNVASAYNRHADIGLQIAAALDTRLERTLPAALTRMRAAPSSSLQAFVFRSVARPFGHNAQPRSEYDAERGITTYHEWTIDNPLNTLDLPVAAFTVDPLIGNASTEFQFRNLSCGESLTYVWDFGDSPDNTSTDPNPTHTYEDPGVYTVTLTATNDAGSSTVQGLVNVTGSTTPPDIEIMVAAAEVVGAVAAVPQAPDFHTPDVLYLDNEYKVRVSEGWVVVEGPEVPGQQLILNMSEFDAQVGQRSLAAYGMSGKTTFLKLQSPTQWLTNPRDFSAVRSTVVYAESEELVLAEEPIEAPICDGVTSPIELEELYTGMRSGRWVIISGERADILDPTTNLPIRGVKASELAMLAEVIQDVSTEDGQPLSNNQDHSQAPAIAGDQTHTWIRLAKQLAYCYWRDSVVIYGNVLKATHGETRKETLGNGDASQPFQTFTLKQSPLTFISSPTPAGAESTLSLYVNDVRWREADSLADLSSTDHNFITKTDDAGKTTIIGGNGERGARFPTGLSNIRAEYRSGIGRPGNVQAEQIGLLLAKPLGVQSVRNPLRASGGADRESMDTARKNAPLTVTALDRLVSVSDYADFARTFAGIGKSAVALLTDGQRQVVHVTIAGADDIPIDESSDLFGNLRRALRDSGDADVPIALQVRELLLLVLSANIKILPDYQWEPVAKAVRTKLLDVFSFERRELGQDVFVSEVISAIQSVRGVEYVDVDVLGGIPEKETFGTERRQLSPQEINQRVQAFIAQQQATTATNGVPRGPRPPVGVNLAAFDASGMRPAQLAYFTPTVTDTIVLNQVR